MLSIIATTLGLIAATASAGGSISITPHDKFSSSVGVLGCHINTNRVAYWPMFPSCDSVCVKVTANQRSVHLLQIDSSGGAYDMSYDAWNYLNVGKSATAEPTMGGGIPAQWESVPMSDPECQALIKTPDKKLPLMAANSIGYYVGCAGKWVGKNSALYNIANSACTLGFDERCELDLAVSNQPKCAHILGAQNPLSLGPDKQVKDIAYGTGALVAAVQ
jgi:hypothetical protein